MTCERKEDEEMLDMYENVVRDIGIGVVGRG